MPHGMPDPDELVILELLAGHGEMYGLELVRASAGRLSRSLIYVTLQHMEVDESITSRQEAETRPEIGIPRRLYRATQTGESKRRDWEIAQAIATGALATA